MTLLIFILLLIVLILVHEFGHFSVAKFFGIRVDEFGIFFPPRLFAWKRGETEYSFNALPFGGFVKIFGESTTEEGVQTDPRSLVRKPRLVQTAVIVAGVVFNILFAWLALSAAYMYGLPTSVEHKGVGQVQDARVTVVQVLPESPAAKAGLLAEDVVVGAQTGTAELPQNANADQLQAFIAVHQDESVLLTVARGGEEKTFLAKPIDGLVEGHKAIGVSLDDVGMLQLPVHLALVQGAVLTYQMTVGTAVGLGGFFYSIVTGTANWGGVAGPIGIAGIGSSAVQDGLIATIILMSLISINLAIINLLPIPGLDGGRLLFIIIESIIRRPISEKLSLRLTVAGFALLAMLMIVVSFHDILRLVG